MRDIGFHSVRNHSPWSALCPKASLPQRAKEWADLSKAADKRFWKAGTSFWPSSLL